MQKGQGVVGNNAYLSLKSINVRNSGEQRDGYWELDQTIISVLWVAEAGFNCYLKATIAPHFFPIPPEVFVPAGYQISGQSKLSYCIIYR